MLKPKNNSNNKSTITKHGYPKSILGIAPLTRHTVFEKRGEGGGEE